MTEQLEAGASPQSAQHHRDVLRNALNAAMRWGYVGRKVASLASPTQVTQREVRALTSADARVPLAPVLGDRPELLLTVALSQGLRLPETLGLRWTDLDLHRGDISVQRTLQRIDQEYQFLQPKTLRSRRRIPLPEPVIDALREHRTRQLEERLKAGMAWQGEEWGSLVFADEIGRPLSGFRVSRPLPSVAIGCRPNPNAVP